MAELYLLLSLPEWLWSATTGTQLLPPSVMLHARKCQGTECMQLHLLEQVEGGICIYTWKYSKVSLSHGFFSILIYT